MFCVDVVTAILPSERGRSGSVPPQSPPGKFCLAGKRLRLRRKNSLTVWSQHCLESRESWFLHVQLKKNQA